MRALASVVLGVLLALPAMAQDASRPLRIYGNTTTLELAPVLLAARTQQPGPAPVSNGGVPNLFNPGEADVATNAETQALRVSVDHPDLRIILTVSEGFYRIVARRSAGIAKLADLRGKKIGTVPRTSAGYYLNRMLATVGLSEADVTIVPVVPLNKVPAAMKNGEIDAVAIWEPEVQTAKNQLGADAIEFQDRTVYRELFNLNTTAAALADPARRKQIVALVRSIVRTSAQIRRDPQEARAVLAKTTGYDEKLIEQVWHHEGYPGTLVPDLLEVLVQEEPWVAKERNRAPRSKEDLAKLIDESVLKEALALEHAETTSLTPDQRLQRVAAATGGEEAIRAIKRLQHAYSHYAEAGRWSDVVSLFTTRAQRMEGGAQIARSSAGKQGTPDGTLHSVLFLSPVITLDADGKTARGRWHALFMNGQFGTSASWRGGIYENEYVQEGGVWKISKEQFYPQYEGPYAGGWRSIVSSTGAPPALVPYHYTPDRAGSPVPELDASLAARAKPVSFDQQARQLAQLETRLRHLNDTTAVQNLQHAYGFYTDRKMWDDVADLFTDGGTLELAQQGVFVGRTSIRRALDQFGPQGLQEGQVNDRLQLETIVSVSPDGTKANARGFQLSMTGVNGQGAQWGTAVYENTYVKENGVWKIASMHVYPRMTTDYTKGWAQDAIPVQGPVEGFEADRPPTQVFKAYPAFHVPPFHFASPAKGAVRTVGGATAPKTPAELESRLAAAERLLAQAEAQDAAENVSNAYGYYIDEFVWDDTADLFSTTGAKELSYIGLYVGRERIRKSLFTRYGNGGRRGVFMAIHQKTQPFVTVSADGQSAKIRSRLFQVNSQTQGEGSYIAGIYENLMVKEQGVWKIQNMDLDYTWTTGYTAGWARVKPGDAQAFSPREPFPFPPDGPLRGVSHAPFPKVDSLGFHFRNPVSGRAPPVLIGAGASTAGMSLEARVQREEDVEAIRRVLREYGKRLDAGDLQGYADLFATDGEWIGGFGAVKGRANIAPFMQKSMSTPLPVEGPAAAVAKPGPRGAHLMTNDIIDVNGDQATAWSRWTYLSRNAEGRPVPVMVGHYDDTLVRENGEWKILKRVVWGDVPYAPPPSK